MFKQGFTFVPFKNTSSIIRYMKNSMITPLAFALLCFAACQNNSGTPAATPGTAGAVVSTNEPASNPDSLKLQILSDFFAARKMTHQLDTLYKQSMLIARDAKSSLSMTAQGENAAKMKEMYEQVGAFPALYDQYQFLSAQLDSLSAHLTAGSISVADAQKEYLNLRAQLITTGEKLTAAQGKLSESQAAFEQVFKNANKKAEGQK